MSDLYLSVGERGTSTNELDLDDGVNYIARDGGFLDGGDGELSVPLAVFGETSDERVAAQRALERKLRQAKRASGPRGIGTPVTLGFRHNTTDIAFYDVLDGAWETTRRWPGGDVEEGVLTLQVTPGTRGATVTDAPVSGLDNLAMPIERADVGGDRATARMRLTLTDESASGAINKLHIGRVAGDDFESGDFTPIVDLAPMSGASSEVESDAVGGSVARREVSGSAWLDLADAAMPAGILNRGRIDVWGRVRDFAAALGAPSNLNSTLQEPAGTGPDISRQQTAAGNNGAGATTVAATWPSATLTGSLLALAVKAQHEPLALPERLQENDGGGTGTTTNVSWSTGTLIGSLLILAIRFEDTMDVYTPPSGWTVAQSFTNTEGADTDVTTVILYKEDAASHTSTQSLGTFSVSTNWGGMTAEYINIAPSQALDHTQGQRGVQETSFEQSSLAQNAPALIFTAVGVGTTHSGALVGSWSAMTSVTDGSGDRFATAEAVLEAPSSGYTHGGTFRTGTHDWAMVSVVFRGAVSEPDPLAVIPPAGYSVTSFNTNFEDTTKPVTTALFYRQDAPASSGSQTVTFDRAVVATCRLIEYTNVATSAALESVVIGDSVQTINGVGPADQPSEHDDTLALGVFGAYETSTTWSGYSGGFSEIGESNGLAVAEAFADQVTNWSVAAVLSTFDPSASILAVFNKAVAATDPPGDLEPGTYSFRVRAIDSSGNHSNATSSHNRVVNVQGSAVNVTWVAPSPAGEVSYYELYWSRSGVVRKLNTPTNATSFLLTSEEFAAVVAALPETTGATPSPNWLRARVGLDSGGTAAQLLVRTARGSDFHLVHFGTLDLPGAFSRFDGEAPDWRIEIQALSGGGPAADVDIDALWLFHHDEPQLIVEATEEITTPTLWVIEQRPDGRIAAWLEDALGVVVGSVNVVGELSLAPGLNFLTIAAEQASGEFELTDTAFEIELSHAPGYMAQIGDGS